VRVVDLVLPVCLLTRFYNRRCEDLWTGVGGQHRNRHLRNPVAHARTEHRDGLRAERNAQEGHQGGGRGAREAEGGRGGGYAVREEQLLARIASLTSLHVALWGQFPIRASGGTRDGTRV
jgi:hypothetical protein